jgi:hypothetical protein
MPRLNVYVTGDAGEDLYSYAMEGSRGTPPRGGDHPADTVHDLKVPSGAPFIACALDSILKRNSATVRFLAQIPNGTVARSGKPMRTDTLQNEKLEEKIIHLNEFGEKKVLRYAATRVVAVQGDKRRNHISIPTLNSNRNLLLIHYCDIFGKMPKNNCDRLNEWMNKTFFSSVRGNNEQLTVLINMKSLPRVKFDKKDGKLHFEDAPSFWNTLQDNNSSVAIVVALSALRRAGAAISYGLSWEQTVEDLLSELYHFPQLRKLSEIRHLFVRFETAGILHIQNRKDEDGARREAKLYFLPDGTEVDNRDPSLHGGITGKNTVLLACLIDQISKGWPSEPAEADKLFGKAIRGINAVYDNGYGERKKSIANSKNPKAFIDNLFSSAKKLLWSESATSRSVVVGNCQVPDHLLRKSDPRRLPETRQWRMLNDLLEQTPIHRINIAIAVVKEGLENVLNWEGEKWPNERVRDILMCPEFWNPQERSRTDKTLEDGERPAMPPPFEMNFPLVEVDKIKLRPLFVPVATFGKLTVVEREAIEALASIKALLATYLNEQARDKKPVSIAVFGPPGSGKGFTVKQIAETIDPQKEKIEILECNVAQFRSTEDLSAVLTRVTSINNKGNTPMVIFDEFDCDFEDNELGWLKYFLAPMQDGNFYGAQQTVHFGRAIFVFAGGIYPTFEKFDPKEDQPVESVNTRISDEYQQRLRMFAEHKGPDFISRLRGHINVLGVNSERFEEKHIIRRSITLRSLVKGMQFLFPKDGKNGPALLDEAVIFAMLTVDRYRHGVRSMEQILRMCTPIDGHINPGSLPSRAQLNMHVDASNFYARLYNGRIHRYLPRPASVSAGRGR